MMESTPPTASEPPFPVVSPVSSAALFRVALKAALCPVAVAGMFPFVSRATAPPVPVAARLFPPAPFPSWTVLARLTPAPPAALTPVGPRMSSGGGVVP